MKAAILAICIMLVLAGTVMAQEEWNDGYDSWGEEYGYGDAHYGDYGYGCCCAPIFVLLAAGAFAFQRRQ